MSRFCCQFDYLDFLKRGRRIAQLAIIVVTLLITGCDLDPFDYDNLRAHGTLDFVAYEQPYHREWDFILHRNGAFSIDLGAVDEWSISPAGFLITGPNQRDFLIDAWMAQQIPGRNSSGQSLQHIWPDLARNRIINARVPVVLLDSSRKPNVISFPPDKCDVADRALVCSAALKLELLPDQSSYHGKLVHDFGRGPDLVRNEKTGSLIKSLHHNEWLGLSYVVCPSSKWRNSGLSSQQIALLERTAVSGGVTVTINKDSSQMQSVCRTFSEDGGWAKPSVERYWMAYDGGRAWSIPDAPNSQRTLYRSDISDYDTSWSCCWDANAITLGPGVSFTIDRSPHAQAQAFVDGSTDNLIIMLPYL